MSYSTNIMAFDPYQSGIGEYSNPFLPTSTPYSNVFSPTITPTTLIESSTTAATYPTQTTSTIQTIPVKTDVECENTQWPLPSIIIIIIGLAAIIYISVVSMMPGRKIFSLILVSLWVLIWAIIIYITWINCMITVSWLLLMIPIIFILIFVILVIWLNVT